MAAVIRVLAAERDHAQCPFGGVVVYFELTIVGIAGERGPAGEGVADRRRRVGFARELCEACFEPEEQAIEQRPCPGLPDLPADLWGASSDLSFDGVESGDPLDGFGRDLRSVGDMDLVELASRVSPARNFNDVSCFVELLEACVGVGLESTLVELKVLAWVLALAVWRVGEPHGRRGWISRWPIVANVGPEPSGLRPAVAWREHRDRSVVGVQLGCGHDVNANCFDQRIQQLTGRSYPSSQRGAIEIHSLARVDLRLPVERKVVSIPSSCNSSCLI